MQLIKINYRPSAINQINTIYLNPLLTSPKQLSLLMESLLLFLIHLCHLYTVPLGVPPLDVYSTKLNIICLQVLFALPYPHHCPSSVFIFECLRSSRSHKKVVNSSSLRNRILEFNYIKPMDRN